MDTVYLARIFQFPFLPHIPSIIAFMNCPWCVVRNVKQKSKMFPERIKLPYVKELKKR